MHQILFDPFWTAPRICLDVELRPNSTQLHQNCAMFWIYACTGVPLTSTLYIKVDLVTALLSWEFLMKAMELCMVSVALHTCCLVCGRAELHLAVRTCCTAMFDVFLVLAFVCGKDVSLYGCNWLIQQLQTMQCIPSRAVLIGSESTLPEGMPSVLACRFCCELHSQPMSCKGYLCYIV